MKMNECVYKHHRICSEGLFHICYIRAVPNKICLRVHEVELMLYSDFHHWFILKQQCKRDHAYVYTLVDLTRVCLV